MKKIIIGIVALIIILLVTGYLEINHCRSLIATGPAPEYRLPDAACQIIGIPGVFGAILIELVR